MNLDKCAMSISSEASSSLHAIEPEPIIENSPELNIKSKILKAKSSDSSSFDNNCSPAKKTRLEEDLTNNPTSSGVSSCSQENETLFLTESSSLASSTNCSNNINSLFKNVQAQHNKPLKNNDIQNPRQLLRHLVPSLDLSKIPSNLDDFDICRLVYKIMSSQNTLDSKQIDLENLELPSTPVALNHASAISSLFLTQREKLMNINTIEDCVDLIYNSKNIIVLTGAGCSVSCGIPDFRSRDGIYARLRNDFPDLPDPQSMFDIFYFEHDPRPFFKFAKEIFPGQFKPSLSHMFIKNLEQSGRLLRNYTQNIDTLELTAEIKNVIQCHGSFATATCTVCKYKVNSEYIKDKIFQQEIPYCDKCSENGDSSCGILKPDIVFFGEGLPEEYHNSINDDKNKCDLLIVIGSSLKVKPVANIPHLLPKEIPQILINRESLKHLNFDVELLGDCDIITNELLMRLNLRQTLQHDWSIDCKPKILLNKIEDEEADKFIFHSPNQSETSLNDSIESNYSSKVMNKDFLKENSFLFLKPNIYVFHGAEVSVKSMRKKIKRLRNLLDGNFKEELDEDDFETEEEFSTEDETDEDDDEEEDDSEKDDENNDAIYKPVLNGIINDDEYDEENDEDFKINNNDSLKEKNKFN